MANIAENFQVILKAKNDLKNSINAKNAGAITDSTPFSAYSSAIDTIEIGGSDMSNKVVSDSIDVKDYTDSDFTVVKCIKKINIPTTVASLGDSCFSNFSSLSAITIPDGVTSLGGSCFINCSSLTCITIPDGVTSIGDYCFQGCLSLTGITIPDSTTSIGSYCFGYCFRLTSITIHDNALSLGDWCFISCSSLTEVTIGNSVTSFGWGCFQGCSSLISITCKATTPPTLGSDPFGGTHSELVIYVPAESVDAYKSATNWSRYADRIQAIA